MSIDWKKLLRQGIDTATAAGNAAYAAAQDGLKVLTSGKGFNGTTAAAALVITADGKVDNAELDAGVKNIKAFPAFGVYSDREILDALNAQLKEAAGMPPAMAQRHLLGKVRDNITNRSAQEVLVELLLELAISDGKADHAEVQVIKEVVKTFGLNEADFPRLATAAAGEMKVGGGGAWS